MSLSQKTQQAATAHLAKWEPLRPISEEGLQRWADEQIRLYSMPHAGGPRPYDQTIAWMCVESDRLKSTPTPDEEGPHPPPEMAIVAWKWNQLEKKRAEDVEQKKLDAAKKDAEAKKSSRAPAALRRWFLFNRDGTATRSAPAPPVASGEDYVTVSTADGSLSCWRADHDESKCDLCQVITSLYA